MNKITLTITVAFVALAFAAGDAESKKLSAKQIVDEMIKRDPIGYGGAEARVLMVLVNKRGQKRTRKMVTMSRNDDSTRRMFVRFNAPADISGTAFLGVNTSGTRVQHLYLPALSKVRRISGSNRNSRFVGSDYTYADMDYTDIDNSAKSLTGSESIGGQDCYVVDVKPTEKDSQYARVRLWISKKTMLPLVTRYYDGKGKEIKRMISAEVKKKGKRWIVTESKMVDLKRGHTTVLKVVDVTLRDDVPMSQFTVRALDRE